MSSINQVSSLHKLYSQYQIQKNSSDSSNSSQSINQNSMRNSFPMDSMSFSSEGMQALREERMSAMKAERSEALDALVEDGTITEDQKTAIMDAFEKDFANMENNMAGGKPPMGPPPGGMGKHPMGPPPGEGVQGISSTDSNSTSQSSDATSALDEDNPLKALLDRLLEEGTIDEEEQNALYSIFAKQQQQQQQTITQ